MTATRLLERPVWDALATRQLAFSIGGDRARRFAPDIAPFAASRDNSPESLRALAELVPDTGTLLLLQADEIVLPSGIVAVTTAAGVQMVGSPVAALPLADGSSERAGDALDPPIVRLTETDGPAMLDLAMLTKPGPFASRTPSLGEFWGIKREGRLVAMAGERMKHAGFTEVSGVCTHPEARGRGFGRLLSAWVSARIVARGETPYLHAYASNTVAIELYRSLGFTSQRSMNVAAIARA